MANLSISEARGLFTRELIAVFDESKQLAPKSFLLSFFKKKTTDQKNISIQVRRGQELIAVDVLRGTGGNRNTISKHSEKLLTPPYFKEWFDATELDRYDLLFGEAATSISASTFNGMIENAIEKTMLLKDKINRTYELYASQVFESGIVQLTSGDNIDFKRKATSMVDLTSSGYFNNTDANPMEAFTAAGNFLRQIGKAGDGVFNVIMGSDVLTAFISNPFVTAQNYNLNIKLIELNMPQVGAEGGVYHGQFSAGSYKFNIWSYPEIYDLAGVATPYIDTDQAYVLPVNSFEGYLSFAGVPAIVKGTNDAFPEFVSQIATDFYLYNYVDPAKESHVFGVKSAAIPIPVTIDRIYSMKAYGTVENGVVA
jgi:hypothetical protein